MNQNQNNEFFSGSAEPDYRLDKRALSRMGLGCFAATAISTGLSLLADLIVARTAPQIRDSWIYSVVMQVVIMYCIAIPSGILIIRTSGIKATEPPADEKMSLGGIIYTLIVSSPLTLLGVIASNIINQVISAVSGGSNSSSGISALISDWPLWAIFLIVVVVGPIAEELLFRKTLTEALRPWGWKFAAFVSGAAFGLFHGNVEQMVYAFIIGVLLACVYLKTGKIRYSIILHMAFNFFGSFVTLAIMRLTTNPADLEAYAELANSVSGSYLSEMPPEFAELSIRMMPFTLATIGYYAFLGGVLIAGLILIIPAARSFSFREGERKIQRSYLGDTMFLAPGVILFILISVVEIVLSVLL